MGQTKPQTNQLDNVPALLELGTPADSSVDSILTKTSQSFRTPLRLYASATPDAKLNISGSQVSSGNGTGKSVGVISTAVPSFVDTTIDFQTGTITGGTVNGAFPASTAGQYRRVGFSLKSDGTVDMVFSAEVVSLGSLANPATLFNSGNRPIGWIDVEATASTSFKTAGSASNIVENSVSGTARIVNAEPATGTETNTASSDYILLQGPNGTGSTYGFNRRFSSVVVNTATWATYADSATDGASITINENGIYYIQYSDAFASVSLSIAISKNKLTPSVITTGAVPDAARIAVGRTQGADAGGFVSASVYLTSGDVIRFVIDAGSSDTVNTFFTQALISKIG